MSSENKGRMLLAAVLTIIIGAFFVVSWPSYRHASTMNETIEAVQNRIQNKAQETKSLETLAQRLGSVQTASKRDLREIPHSTNMASLITALTVEVDHRTVYDQTFSTSRVRSISGVNSANEEETVFVLPLAIDMDATFPVVFDLLTKVEQLQRLVRVSNIRIEQHSIHEHLVRATVNLELVFEPVFDGDDADETGGTP